MTTALSVLRWIRYGEYVDAWASVPIHQRPHYRIMMTDLGWRAISYES